MLSIMHINQIAKVCHEVNRSYCQALGDNSQPTWEEAPLWQRSSAIDGVMFHLDNPNAGPEASHENWLKQKQADGWVYGKEKNPELKTHPCFVPFNDLPPSQKAKDYLFRTIVHQVAAMFD